MTPTALGVTFVTERIAEARAFYEQHFGAKASFDCGWYVVLKLGGTAEGHEICFMEPQAGAAQYAGGAVLNLTYTDVDAVHQSLTEGGLTPVVPLEDHPWGDRGFGVIDPLGTMVYCLTPIAISDEFAGYQRDLA